MKSFNKQHLAILPLLSILSMSPSVMESKIVNGRHIASVSVPEVKHPKYEELVSQLDKSKLQTEQKLSEEDFKKKLEEFKTKLTQEKEQKDKEKVEDLAKDLAEIEMNATEGSAKDEGIIESKDQIEQLLTDTEIKTEEPKKEESVEVAVVEEPKKEEPAEVKPEEPKKEVCEAEEKNKVLTAQVEELLKQNQQILQAMMGMTQMMLSMNQNRSPNPYFSNGDAFQMQNPYQYHQPFTAGNWVYYPTGFQPSQPNIFAQPAMPQQPSLQSQHGIYPDVMHQQSNWSLQPTNYFADPRYQVQPVLTGNFGDSGFSYNFGNQAPTVSLN